jgi:hypothetical protein
MNRNRNRALSLLTVAVIALGTFQPLQARTLMASAGRTLAAADAGCFMLGYSSMTNVCGAAMRLETPLPLDTAGWVTVKVNAYGPTASSNVGCEAIGINDAFTAAWGYGIQWLPAFGSVQSIYTSTYVPTGGGLYLYCDVYPNGRVQMFTW